MTVSLSPLKMSSGPPGTEIARSLALVRSHDRPAALVDIAAGMSEQAMRAEPDMRRAAGGEGVAAEQFAAELDELPRRRQPAKLDAIIVVLVVEEDPVGQRLVGKVPGMRMLLIEIADPREETARS